MSLLNEVLKEYADEISIYKENKKMKNILFKQIKKHIEPHVDELKEYFAREVTCEDDGFFYDIAKGEMMFKKSSSIVKMEVREEDEHWNICITINDLLLSDSIEQIYDGIEVNDIIKNAENSIKKFLQVCIKWLKFPSTNHIYHLETDDF